MQAIFWVFMATLLIGLPSALVGSSAGFWWGEFTSVTVAVIVAAVAKLIGDGYRTNLFRGLEGDQ